MFCNKISYFFFLQDLKSVHILKFSKIPTAWYLKLLNLHTHFAPQTSCTCDGQAHCHYTQVAVWCNVHHTKRLYPSLYTYICGCAIFISVYIYIFCILNASCLFCSSSVSLQRIFNRSSSVCAIFSLIIFLSTFFDLGRLDFFLIWCSIRFYFSPFPTLSA